MFNKNINLNIFLFFITFSLLFCIDNKINKIYSSLTSISLEELYKTFYNDKMRNIISSSIEGMKTYVYSDIILSPPEVNYYPKFNTTEELTKIDVSRDRPFYEFYRDYKRTLNGIKDINLIVLAEQIYSSTIIDFSKYSVCLPFQFRLDYDENNEIKLFISEFPECSAFYDISVHNFIKNNVNHTLISINDFDPFEFIQNFGKDFYDTKNPHARFSLMLRNIHCFFLNMIPLKEEELSGLQLNWGESEHDKLILDFHVVKPENLFDDNELGLLDLKEFDMFFKQEMKNKDGFGNVFEIKNNFLKSKNIYNNVNSIDDGESIKWDYESDNLGLKCKVDNSNKLNIFLQTSFNEK